MDGEVVRAEAACAHVAADLSTSTGLLRRSRLRSSGAEKGVDAVARLQPQKQSQKTLTVSVLGSFPELRHRTLAQRREGAKNETKQKEIRNNL
jgi:hypothetical protein